MIIAYRANILRFQNAYQFQIVLIFVSIHTFAFQDDPTSHMISQPRILGQYLQFWLGFLVGWVDQCIIGWAVRLKTSHGS